MDIGGVNGSEAIVQFAISAEATSTNPVVTLSSFSSPDNATFGVAAFSVGDPTTTKGVGFVELSNEQVGANGTGTHAQFRSSPDTTVGVTYAPAVRNVVIGIEIKNSVQPGADTFLEFRAVGTTGESEVMVDDSSGSARDLVIGTRSGAGDLRLFNRGIEGARLTATAFDLGLNNLAFGSAFAVEDTILARDGSADTLAMKRLTNVQTFRVYETFPAGGGDPAVTQTLLLAELDEVDRVTYTTGSISPGADKLILCAVSAADFGFSTPISVVSVTGAGLNWVKVAEVQYDTIAGPRLVQALFRALGPTPSPGALSITMSTPPDNKSAFTSWIISEFDNIDTGGSDGADAIVQSATNRTDSGTGLVVTLAAFGHANNATYGCFSLNGSRIYTPGSGFAEITEQAGSMSSTAIFRDDNDTTVDVTASGGALAQGGIAVEIKRDSTSGDHRYLELIGLGVSGGVEVMAVTGAGVTDRDLVVGTRGDADLKLFRNNLEQVRISDISTDLGLNNLAFGSAFGVEDTILLRDGAADTLAQRRGTNAQTLNIYNTFTDATDNELGEIGFIPVADVFVIGTKKGSAGGTARPMSFRTDEIEALAIGIDQKSTFMESVLIDGATDSVQLTVRGHSTQSANIFVVDRDDDQDLFTVDDLGFVALPAYDIGNDVPGRCILVGRNTHVADEGPAPGSVELEAADGVSLFLWADDEGDVRVHTAKATGSTGTPTVDANVDGFKLSPLERDHFHFASRIGSFGVEFTAGGYTFSTDDANLDDASPTITIGTANHPYYAHAFLVAAAAGAASGGAGEVEIEVSGTSIDDTGTRVTSDTEIIVADITAMATDQYFETVKKWIGTVTYTLQVAGGGTHTTFNADFNYGLAKYEDFGNMDFEITGFELTGRAGATDTGFNVELCEHKAVGWTYAATGFVAGLGTALVDVAAIWSTESDLDGGELFSFKKLDISSQIAGSVEEGYLIRVTTGANAAVETMNLTVTARLN
jgi:hypothetical protein